MLPTILKILINISDNRKCKGFGFSFFRYNKLYNAIAK
jgi:hypothetical protein